MAAKSGNDTGSVTTKGQLVIPARIRRMFGIRAGTRVHFLTRDSEIILQPMTSTAIRNLCGALKSERPVVEELLEERALDKQREERKLANFRPR